ncbi:protein FAM193A-like [Phyllostomus hastatus]|uniref:protein FAM193A-like n=1 Tax=Phyllostomus hastatus TaxID=9423 RepID=UPI001E682B71|nr:protein FAM193A-like [Phyllostomus hastatus]
MSPSHAKGGAKRRKNKRGGGGGDRGRKGRERDRPEAEPCSSLDTAIMPPGVAAMSVAAAVADMPLVEDVYAGGAAAFSLGETQGTLPYPTGIFCVCCKIEEKDSAVVQSGDQPVSELASEGDGASHQTHWVCPTCQWTLDNYGISGDLDQAAQGLGFLSHGHRGDFLAEAEGGMLAEGGQLPALDTESAYGASCEPQEISPDSYPESQQLRIYWSEVRFMVRFTYHQAGTALVPNMSRVKEHVDRLCNMDPSQLYERLDRVARDFVLDMKIRLLQPLWAQPGPPTCLESPLQAQQFISRLIKEYGALCQAARTISTFLITLEIKHLSLFQVTWELHNKHLFENLIFSDHTLQSNLPALISQIRLGATTNDTCSQGTYATLLLHYQGLEEELHRVARKWVQCQRRISTFILEKMTLKTNLKKALTRYKETQFLEEHLTSTEADLHSGNLAEALRHMPPSSSLDMPDCLGPERCTIYNCNHSQFLTCGLVEPQIPSTIHGHQQPLRVRSLPDCLFESHLPGVSLATSRSDSSSPVITQQQSRPIRLDEVSPPSFGSDSDVASLSDRFADIYLVNTDDIEVVTCDDDNTEIVTNVRSDAQGNPEGLLYDSSLLAIPAAFSPDPEEQLSNQGAYGWQQDPREKSTNNSEHSSRSSSWSCACNLQEEGKYCEFCGKSSRHHRPPATASGRSYEEMRVKLRLRLAKRKEEQPKKTGQLPEKQDVVDHRTVEDLLQFINGPEIKPVSSTRKAKRERHKQRKLEEKAHMHSGSLEQTEELETSSHSPSRGEDHAVSGAQGDSKHLLPKQHKDGTGKKKLKQTGKAGGDPRRRSAESPRASEGQSKSRSQTQPSTKVLHLVLLAEQRKMERKARSENKGKKQLSQVKEGKATPGPGEPASPSKLEQADTPQSSNKSKESRKGDGDNNPLYDVFMPKDIDLESADMDETEREVEHFKRFCLDSTRQARQRLSVDWSDFSLKKPHFLPPK